jgi:hypothetical protein
MKGTRAILVLSALISLPAFADEPAPSPTSAAAHAAPAAKPEAKKAVKKAAPKPAAGSANLPAGSANMIVTKDAETGELRPATAAERQQLLSRQPLAAPQEHRVVTLPDGSVMVELTDADRSYAVATRNPDGTLSQSCVHGAAQAAKAATSPAPVSTSAPAPATDR